MRRVGVVCLAGLGGCFYNLVPEASICEDVAFGISERTLVCQGDEALANARYHRFMDTATCLLDEEVTAPYNPEGTLPAYEDTAATARLDGLYECVRQVRAAPCEKVPAQGEDMSWWLSLDPRCAEIATAPGDYPSSSEVSIGGGR